MRETEYIGKTIAEATEEFGSQQLELALEVLELNVCDKCATIELTKELIWICDDFEPKPNEILSDNFYEYWGDSALCLKCYEEEIKNVVTMFDFPTD